MSAPLTLSTLDLTDGGNVTQARHELHRAVDFGGDVEQAAWCRKWGEPAMSAAERAAGEAFDFEGWPGAETPKAVNRAVELGGQLRRALLVETPDIEQCRRLVNQLDGKLSTIAEAFEEE